ncbi:hypothetical protein KZC52_11880 [Microbacterium sp. kSW2-24]|uniref:hypothetical protein n=1 Tax=Microbacterium galbinum TaxID=2851646 RepID=UPI001FFDCBC3|nr:hypothetical protein [Microbacterium galbinum]MCK2023628.1 hypothetical protein [Microbacterium galbinum]
MDQWKWNLGQAGILFVGAMVFSLVIAAVGASWWVALVVPAAFLSSGIMLTRALRERRRERRVTHTERRP